MMVRPLFYITRSWWRMAAPGFVGFVGFWSEEGDGSCCGVNLVKRKLISEIKVADIPDVDLSSVGVTKYGNFRVEIVDPVSDYLDLMEEVFDFSLIKNLVSRPDFRLTFDAMHAVTGAYAKPIFVDKLGASLDSICNGVPLEDFGHSHPDPNLTYFGHNILWGLARFMPTSGALDRVMAVKRRQFFDSPTWLESDYYLKIHGITRLSKVLDL
ncbi:phosphoglucomutase, chloroplastic [Tanacetum coccineum]